MSADRTSDAYVFDRYRLSADGTLLVRDGTVVALAPKVLQILLLVQHAGEVVRKEHLLHTVWPDSFVEDTGLTRNILLLRRALGDDGLRSGASAWSIPSSRRLPNRPATTGSPGTLRAHVPSATPPSRWRGSCVTRTRSRSPGCSTPGSTATGAIGTGVSLRRKSA